MSNENYIVIYNWMKTELGLRGVTLEVYAVIYGFSKDGEGVFNASLQWLADLITRGRRSVNLAITKLLNDELICREERNVTTGGTNVYTVNLNKLTQIGAGEKVTSSKENLESDQDNSCNGEGTLQGVAKITKGVAKNANEGCNDCKGGLQKMQPIINNIINNKIKNNSSSCSISVNTESEETTTTTEDSSSNELNKTAYHDFIESYDIIVDGYNSEISNIDFDKLSEAFAKSRKYLQQRPYCKALSWICRNYKRIIGRYYEDIGNKPTYKVYTPEEEAELERIYADNKENSPF